MLYDKINELMHELDDGTLTVTPQSLTAVVELLAIVANEACGLDEWAEMVPRDSVQDLPPELMAQILMHRFSHTVHANHLTKSDKLLAMDFAEHMGPDWAQALYHFAVRVTREV